MVFVLVELLSGPGKSQSQRTDLSRESETRATVLLGVAQLRAGCAASADAGTACAVPWYVLNGRSRRVVQRPTEQTLHGELSC